MAAEVVNGNERQHKFELNENGYIFISVVFRRTPGCNFTEA